MLDVGAAMTTASGESVSGDMSVVAPFEGGVLVAVVDGLGHGEEAAQAALGAVETMREGAGAPLPAIFEATHKRLLRTRGAVISAAVFQHGTQAMTWVGVGNVEAQLYRAPSQPPRARETVFLAAGVVGYRLPALRPATTPIAHGDTLVLATDGVDLSFSQELDLRLAPQQIADKIIAGHANGADDALALVARVGEGA
jgi:phosphoserine phosphatase RsbX